MKTSLFADDELPESLSPKLAWLRKHGLTIEHIPEFDSFTKSPETGLQCYPWLCGIKHAEFGWAAPLGVGTSEEEAIVDYCWKADIPHYSITP